jgi:LemA protein
MSKGWIGCLVVLGVIVLIVLIPGGWLVGRYNGMVRQNEQVTSAWSQVKVVLQRRADLIPNLVETVKGYASHEKEIFENVAAARSKLAGAVTPQEAAAANTGLTAALGRLLAIAENYPNLKANENFIRLQDELAGSENRIAVERRTYNETVRAFNAYIKVFPNNFLSGMFGFKEREYFEAEEGAKEAPKVKF